MSTSTPAVPPAPAPAAGPKVNRLGLPVTDYQGAKSTLCAGCGHDVITRWQGLQRSISTCRP